MRGLKPVYFVDAKEWIPVRPGPVPAKLARREDCLQQGSADSNQLNCFCRLLRRNGFELPADAQVHREFMGDLPVILGNNAPIRIAHCPFRQAHSESRCEPAPEGSLQSIARRSGACGIGRFQDWKGQCVCARVRRLDVQVHAAELAADTKVVRSLVPVEVSPRQILVFRCLLSVVG